MAYLQNNDDTHEAFDLLMRVLGEGAEAASEIALRAYV